MTTEIDERMELVEPDQDSCSPYRGGSAEEWTIDPLRAPPVQENRQPKQIQDPPARKTPFCEAPHHATARGEAG